MVSPMMKASEANNFIGSFRYQEFAFVEAIYVSLTGVKTEFRPVLIGDAFNGVNDSRIGSIANDK